MKLLINGWLHMLIGTCIAAAGFYVILGDVHISLKAGTSVHVVTQVVGLVLTYVGGYITLPIWTMGLIKQLAGTINPYLPMIGGRRGYDPPAPDEPSKPGQVM